MNDEKFSIRESSAMSLSIGLTTGLSTVKDNTNFSCGWSEFKREQGW
jgi:hypothetical protein